MAAAPVYIGRGYAPIPVPFKSKKAQVKGWPDLRISAEDVRKHFSNPSNLGLLVGEPSDGLIDVDLDAKEAEVLADEFLPQTNMEHGRPSSPRSHRWYRTKAADISTTRFEDPTDTGPARHCLVELRSNGTQTLVPPSVHTSGEPYDWSRDGEPFDVDAGEIEIAVRRLAAATLITRHWNKNGTRNKTALALSGFLLDSGYWSVPEIEHFITVIARAAGDEEWKDRAKSVARTDEKIAADRPVAAGKALEEVLGDEIVEKLRDWLRIRGPRSSQRASSAVELIAIDPPQWPSPLADEAFHGDAGRFVRLVEPHSEGDPAALLTQFLAAFGNACGRNVYVLADGTRHYLNLFVVNIGKSSRARKGSSWGRVKSFFMLVDPQWTKEHVAHGLSSGEGLIAHIADPEDDEKESTRSETDGPRSETVVPQDKRLLVMESELSRPLRAARRETNTLTAVLRQAWDGEDLQVMTRHLPLRATEPHVSLIGHVTVEELAKTLQDVDVHNGLVNRALWALVRRTKLLPRGGSPSPADMQALAEKVAEAVTWARSAERRLDLDANAAAIWDVMYPLLSADRMGLFGDAAARAEAQVLRLAAVYATIDRSTYVRREHMLAALAIWTYVEASLLYVFGSSLGDPVVEETFALICSRPDGVSRSEIRDHFARNRTKAQIERVLRHLLQLDLVEKEMVPTSGRPREVWKRKHPPAGSDDGDGRGFGRFGRAVEYLAVARAVKATSSSGVGDEPIFPHGSPSAGASPCADGEDGKSSNGNPSK